MAMNAIIKAFGGGKRGEPPSPQQAIQKLRETEEMLSKKSEFLEMKIGKELAAAKKSGMKNKRGEVEWICDLDLYNGPIPFHSRSDVFEEKEALGEAVEPD